MCLPSGEKRDLGLNPLFKQRLLSALHEPYGEQAERLGLSRFRDTLTSLQPRSEATEDRLDALAKYSQTCWDKVWPSRRVLICMAYVSVGSSIYG